MCLFQAGKELGANVLPIGLTTDVSAAALAAGAGGVSAGGLGLQPAGPGAGSAAAGAKGSGFANELKAVAGPGAAQEVSGTGKGVPAADVGVEALAAAPRPSVRPAVVDGAAEVAVPTQPDGFPVPKGDIVTGSKQARPATNDTAGIPEPKSAEGQTGVLADVPAGELADVPAETAFAAVVLPFEVLPAVVTSQSGEAVAAALPGGGALPSGGAVPAAVPPAASGVPVGAGVPAATGAPATLPGTAGETAPLPSGAGAGGQAEAGAAANGQNTAAGAGAQVSGVQGAQVTGAQVTGAAAPAADGPRTVPVAKDRRWQNELPQELRAQTYVPARSAAAAPVAGQPAATRPDIGTEGLRIADRLPAPVPGNAATGPAAANVAGVAAASSGNAEAVTAAVAAGFSAAKPAVVADGGAAQNQGQAGGQDTVSGAAAQPAASASVPADAPAGQPLTMAVVGKSADAAGEAAASAGANGKSAPLTASGAPAQTVTAQVPAESTSQLQVLAPRQEGAVPVSALPEEQASADGADAGAVTVKSGLQDDTGRAGQSALERIGLDNSDGGQAPAGRPASPAVAAPIAAATAAADVADDDADLAVTRLTPGGAGELGAATVRGGDMSGAVRTESLQTPNQTQSAHVSTQVAAEIARNLKNGQTRFQMRFDPPELGRVEVHMKVNSDGSVHTHLIVDRPETLDMFLRDQRGLERALENAGLTADSENMQFSLKQDGNRDFASGNDQSGVQAAGQGGSGPGEADEADPVAEDIVRLTLARQRGGLDMKV
ncbi:flagellar hook-length control protein FliK [Roseibium sp. M-1]